MKSIPMNWTMLGTPANPNIHLQCGLIAKAKQDAISWAIVIIATLKATSLPLISTGATSDK